MFKTIISHRKELYMDFFFKPLMVLMLDLKESEEEKVAKTERQRKERRDAIKAEQQAEEDQKERATAKKREKKKAKARRQKEARARHEQEEADAVEHTSIAAAQQPVLNVEPTIAAKEARRIAEGKEPTPGGVRVVRNLATAAKERREREAEAVVQAQAAVAAAEQQERAALETRKGRRVFNGVEFNSNVQADVDTMVEAVFKECPILRDNQSVNSCIRTFWNGTMKSHEHEDHTKHISKGIVSYTKTGTAKSCTIFARDYLDGGFELVGIGKHTGTNRSQKRYTLEFYMHPDLTTKTVLL